nr:hypothetical protein [Micromonospora sp. DSM 115978]
MTTTEPTAVPTAVPAPPPGAPRDSMPPHVMTLDEMIVQAGGPGTAAPPPAVPARVASQPGQLGQRREWLSPEQLEASLRAATGPAAATTGHRPPSLPVEYLPRTAPRSLDGVPAPRQAPRQGAGRAVGQTAGLAPGLAAGLAAGQPTPRVSEQLSSAWPWTTVGRVTAGTSLDFVAQRGGSGVLVGPNLLLTASHCVFWDSDVWWVRFAPLWRGGEDPNIGASYVSDMRGIKNYGDGDVTGYDYVICRLYEPIGHRAGWVGSQWFGDEDRYYRGSWTSVGYPGNFLGGQRPAVELDVRVRDIDNDDPGLEIETVAFTSPGWSGGPLWGFVDGDPRAVGILSGREKDFLDPTRSVFAGGRRLVDLVKHGCASWQ